MINKCNLRFKWYFRHTAT